MDYKEFKTLKQAQDVIKELDAKNGYPIKGNTTLTTADIEQIDGVYCIKSAAINKTVDLKEATDVKIEKILEDTTLRKSKEVKNEKDIKKV